MYLKGWYFLMKKILIILSILLIIFLLIDNENMLVVPDEAIRFRVVSNSNSKEDIEVKEYLTQKIIENNEDLFKTNSIIEARNKINNSISNINKLIDTTFEELSYDKDYKVNYGINYFPKKEFMGVKYNEGYYESLVITIGEGNGENYFCVMFPPLCLVDESSKNIEYKFKIIEILEKIDIKK